MGLLGLLLRIKNTLVLFEASILVNEALLAYGLYLLGGELYRLRLTRLLITLGGVLSVSWLQQSLLNLGVFYLLPLTMYFLVRFFKTGRAAHLGLAGLVEICSNATGVPYFAPLKGVILLVFAIPLCFQYPQAMRTLLTRKGLLDPCLWIIGIVATVVVCHLADSREPGTAVAETRPDYRPRATRRVLELRATHRGDDAFRTREWQHNACR